MASDPALLYIKVHTVRQVLTITPKDLPGWRDQGTIAADANPAGAAAGYYVDTNNVFHGYIRAKRGMFTTFDAPGAGKGPGLGTICVGNNAAGRATGYYVDANGVSHGFLRLPHQDER